MNYIAIELKGTTISGLSTRTTLGNTLRSLAYMYFYIEESGIENPWLNEDIFVIASGDDVVCFCHPRYSK
jgi:hypothetical protein